MGRMKKLSSGSAILLIIAAVLFGRLAYMNVRADDPLPYGFQQYEAAAFEEAQKSGHLVMVDVYASWCPTCLSQHKSLERLLDNPDYENVIGFRVDFDDDQDFLRKYNVNAQSTIIMFDGESEISRTIGVTDEEAITNQLITALAVCAENMS